ncbi:hypothetical protein [Methanosarcina barkeri]|uniref:hypothetical protein n=1 Tax=Methanosarcina barkeri TaxID=2208 RepID=UPI001E5C1E80|nr:hypothetical protein [Methanosarcina barkeri]
MEQELWRSVPVYFVSFLIVGTLDQVGYISIGGIATFILAFIITLIHFTLMVKYRRKEHLTDPSISLIIDHLLQSKNPESRNNTHPESGNNFLSVLTILVIAYLIYRYAV